ncbi:hypothetical protein BT63DRAFT_411653 [Microthyrium microscopicum]|uniref:DNA polymerase delta subunit 3 n=1 Tax=Microthyrium microscopicum TaxID=703497 RepID=A0A6A6UMS3_9PEZI|nr:hypothetical protein BT63DRAFT_411653 [Microthyrium microscopicum]
MDQYNTYLATQVLSEGQIVTYRSLSRALKVHVTLAKQMLYAFHAKESAKDPESISATYLLSGVLRPPSTSESTPPPPATDGEDTIMESSPVPSSWIDQPTPYVEVTQVTDSPLIERVNEEETFADSISIILARQEELEEVKDQFEEINWIHVYSLQPATPADIHILHTANGTFSKNKNRSLATNDPIFGTIQNPNVRTRTVVNAVPISAAPIKGKPSTKSAAQQPTASRAPIETKPAPKPKPKSSLASAFAKTPASKPKTTPITKQPDTKMANAPTFSDDQDEEASDADSPPPNTELTSAARTAKAARQAQLAALIDSDSDAEMANTGADKTPSPAAAEEEEEVDAMAVDTSAALDAPIPKEETEHATVTNGRRRGKRQVVKKRTFEDEDGYLVTREEMEWESFSEDEPAPAPTKKVKLSAASTASSGPNKKKSTGAPSKQGSIMSFFGKK